MCNLELLEIINDVFERKGLDKIVLGVYDGKELHTKLKGHIYLNDLISLNYKGEKAIVVFKKGYIIDKIELSNTTFKEFLEDYVADYIIASRKINELESRITQNFIESFKRENKINEFL